MTTVLIEVESNRTVRPCSWLELVLRTAEALLQRSRAKPQAYASEVILVMALGLQLMTVLVQTRAPRWKTKQEAGPVQGLESR